MKKFNLFWIIGILTIVLASGVNASPINDTWFNMSDVFAYYSYEESGATMNDNTANNYNSYGAEDQL